MTTPDELKKKAAEAALKHIRNTSIIGIGTGSTVDHFIDLLSEIKYGIDGVVSSSESSSKRIKKFGIPVFELGEVGTVEVYVDGADEINPNKQLIKGGGGALTREKIIAGASKQFVCIAEQTKYVDVLGSFPLPVEVIPMARSFVAREFVKLGGQPIWRDNFISDNGNQIIDVHNLDMMTPIEFEKTINNIPGVVTVGIFALRPADLIILSGKDGIREF